MSMLGIGRWVIVRPEGRFGSQSNHGIGRIVGKDNWWIVDFPDGYNNHYEEQDLEFCEVSETMTEPSMELDEIHLAHEIMEGLK